MDFSHRPGRQRQTNKKHKNTAPGQRARKGTGGRTETFGGGSRKSVKHMTNNATLTGSRAVRMNALAQMSKQKKAEAAEEEQKKKKTRRSFEFPLLLNGQPKSH